MGEKPTAPGTSQQYYNSGGCYCPKGKGEFCRIRGKDHISLSLYLVIIKIKTQSDIFSVVGTSALAAKRFPVLSATPHADLHPLTSISGG